MQFNVNSQGEPHSQQATGGDLEAVLQRVWFAIDRVKILFFEDQQLRLRLRAVALEYLKATEEHPSAVDAAPIATAVEVTPPPIVAAPAIEVAAPQSEEELAPQVMIGVEAAQPIPERVTPPSIVIERSAIETSEVEDGDLPLIEQRCRLKAEGARWAAKRLNLIRAGADFRTEIEPLDREIVEKAKVLPDCFLWMCHTKGPQPADASDWDDVAGCFATVASGIGLIRTLLTPDDDEDRFEQALLLLAEGQSALRSAVEQIGWTTDKDQNRIHQWLKAAAYSRRLYIDRHMRANELADPKAWNDLDARIGQLHAVVQQRRQRERVRESLFNGIRYHLSHINRKKGDSSNDWSKVFAAIEELVANGLPPSNRDLRELLLPAVEQMPVTIEGKGMKLVLREIDRFLATQRPAVDVGADLEPSEEVKQVAALIAGRTAVMIGGERRPHSVTALETQFGLKKLDWIAASDHASIFPFERHIARPEVAVVLLAIRWSNHGFGEIKQFCDRHQKPLVRLPAGYNPNQVAAQILAQCGQRLRGDQ